MVSSTERHSTKAKLPETRAWMMGLPSFWARPTYDIKGHGCGVASGVDKDSRIVLALEIRALDKNETGHLDKQMAQDRL